MRISIYWVKAIVYIYALLEMEIQYLLFKEQH